MTVTTTAALFAAMALLAALPSVSVLAVSARAASHGFAQGAWTALGIVVADLGFILLALFGLALLVHLLGDGFVLLKYLGAAYLLALGALLWRAPAPVAGTSGAASRRASFLSGLLITLGDQKAALFYFGFLPAFIDPASVTASDVGIIALVTILAVGGVKLAYAWAADRAGRILGGSGGRLANRLAAVILIAVGVHLAATA